MTETFQLKAEPRATGTKAAVKVREQGLIPAVIYGHKQDSVSIAVDLKLLVQALQDGHRLFDVEFEGKSETLLLKDLQYDHFHMGILHVDFMRVNRDEKAHVTVPVVLKGTAPGVNAGGIVDMHLDHVLIDCPVMSIPEAFEVLITKLGLDEAILASDIKLPAGAELLTDPDAVIVNCHEVVETIEEEGEEEAEPEIITEKHKSEE
ncbi:MAG: 50S ribosomal protein L25 [Phycisphaerae bacterium]|jgi:large subunit ribosomal protein L25